MVVRGKQCTGLCFGMFMQILHDGPGNTDTIVSGSTSSQLIEEHQRLRRNVVQDVRSLGHLHHKRRFSQRNVIRGPYPCEYLVNQTDSRAFCRYEATNLGQQHNQGCLTQQRRFTSHIRTGNNHDLLLLCIKVDIIRHIPLTQGQLSFNHRVPTLLDVYHIRIINHRTDISVLFSHLGIAQ